MWPSRPKWVALLLVYFLGTRRHRTSSSFATDFHDDDGYSHFPKGGAIYIYNINFGFSTKSVSPVISNSTSEKYTCYTHKQFKSVICKCLNKTSNPSSSITAMMKTLFGNFSKWHFLVFKTTLHCHNFKTNGPI